MARTLSDCCDDGSHDNGRLFEIDHTVSIRSTSHGPRQLKEKLSEIAHCIRDPV